jgi:hypothetical protein
MDDFCPLQLAGGKIVNATTLHTLVTPVINETDVVTVEQVAKGHGFLFFPRNRGKNDVRSCLALYTTMSMSIHSVA